jgi:hypothetical protein
MNAGPRRLRLSRGRGFDLQAASRKLNGLEAVNVARPSIFGNPFVVGKFGTREECVAMFGAMLNGLLCVSCTDPDPFRQQLAHAAILGNIRRLTGRNLACWCRLDGKPCHADLLLEVANDPARLKLCDELAGREAKE